MLMPAVCLGITWKMTILVTFIFLAKSARNAVDLLHKDFFYICCYFLNNVLLLHALSCFKPDVHIFSFKLIKLNFRIMKLIFKSMKLNIGVIKLNFRSVEFNFKFLKFNFNLFKFNFRLMEVKFRL